MVVAGIALMAGLLSGCSGGGRESAAPSTAGSSASSAIVSPTPTAEAEARSDALAAYRGMWADMASAATTSDNKSPLLARHATGAALAQIVESLYSDKKSGLISRGAPSLNPQVASLDIGKQPANVVISDCGDDSKWLKYRKSTGKLQNKQVGGRHRIHANVYGLNGSWKVVSFQLEDVGTC